MQPRRREAEQEHFSLSELALTEAPPNPRCSDKLAKGWREEIRNWKIPHF